MSDIENRPVIFEMLDQVRWFSFGKGWEGNSRLTIWQAIAYIMGKSAPAEQALGEYICAIDDAENEMYDELSETSKIVEILATASDDERDRKVKNANRIKAAKELQEWLPILNKNRLITTEHFDIPAVLYQIIHSETQADRDRALKISRTTPQAELSPQLLVTRASLDTWTKVKSLSILGLIGAAEKVSARAIRSQAFGSHEKIIAMFMHLISELFPNDFTPRGKSESITVDKFVQLLVGNATYRESGFPQGSTCASILEKSERTYADFQRKPQLELPEKGYPRLRAHIDKLPKP